MEGNAVRHDSFGKGVVTSLDDNVITVCFNEGEKKFIYPDAFKSFLVYEDLKQQKKIQHLLRLEEERKERMFKVDQAEQARLFRIKNYKILVNSQAAFRVSEEEMESVFTNWCVSTGTYLSGYSKGQPRIPDRLMPNAACLLTYRPAGLPEAERRIIGAFMVKPDFLGDECLDGNISAHETHRLRLTEQEMLPFWPYFSDKPKKSWGSTAYKHFSNRTMADILRDICDIASDSEQKEKVEAFRKYYMRVNSLHDIPLPASPETK